MTDPLSRKGVLLTLRKELLSQLGKAWPKDVAGIARELRAVMIEIESLPNEKADTPSDEIARRREERRRKAVGE